MTHDYLPTMLLINHDQQFSYLIHRYAMHSGCRVMLAINLEEALAQARLVRPALIFFVVMLPAEDWPTLHALRADTATFDLPIAVCTADPNGACALDEGADFYLWKPVMYDDFVSVLTHAGVSLPG